MPGVAAALPVADNYGSGGIAVTDSAPGASGGGGGGGGSSEQWYSYRSVDVGPDGLCWAYHSTTDAAEAAAYNSVYSPNAVAGDGLASLPPCPTGAGAPAPPTPEQLARDFWASRQLPAPTLDVTPDYAVAGKRVFLQIAGAKATTFHVDNPLGPAVDINATSRYVVDWGDGSPPTTTTSQGGAWPDGDVTHVYDRATTAVTIRVTQRWSATWTAGGGSPGGTLDDLQTGSTLTLRVEQVQPVRNR
ncbi:MAG TPA: hypothetical protein VM938_07800 [Acidimicrobiales bacterium]|nr:hypothetical protein [Acidimicrobiales bacterium]